MIRDGVSSPLSQCGRGDDSPLFFLHDILSRNQFSMSGYEKAVVRGKRHRLSGFTLVELVTIIVILGILAAVVMPRFFSRDIFDSRAFHDQVIAALHYAQKAAIAKRRFVCVSFGTNSVTLTYDTTAPSPTHTAANCPGTNFAGPDGTVPYTVSSNKASFSSLPAAFSFDSLGQASAAASIQIGGASAITVDAGTGYVR